MTMFWELLETYLLWLFFKFQFILIQQNKYWKYDWDLCWNEESDYSEENASDNEDFRPTILQLIQFEPE